MSKTKRLWVCGLLMPLVISGCGVFVPQKNIFIPPDAQDAGDYSLQGNFENGLVGHIKCGIEKGLWRVKNSKFNSVVPWLTERIPVVTPAPAPTRGAAPKPPTVKMAEWGTSVNLTIQVDESGGLSPGVTLMTPLENSLRVFPAGGNVTIPQSISYGIGVSATAHATRTETIQFTYSNPDLLSRGTSLFKRYPDALKCDNVNGIMIESDLRIDQFIYDKATIAAFGNDISTNRKWAPYSVFQDEIIFVASYGGNATPTWKFARVAVNPNSPTLSATRSDTNTLIITLGEVGTPATPVSPAMLTGAAGAQHNNAAAGAATGLTSKSLTGN